MSRFVVTGASGFIGSHLVRRLLDDGHEVIAPLRSSSVMTEAPQLETVDASSFDALVNSFSGAAGVFHLATVFRSSHSHEDVRQMVETNVEFCGVVGEATLQAGVPALVYTESATQHFQGQNFSPMTLYASTKQAGSDILRFYCKQGIDMVFLSLFDTMGPRDRRGKLLSLLQQTAESGDTLKMSPGDQLVDYLYVDDVVDGLLRAMELAPVSGAIEPLNARLTSSNPVKLREFVELVETVIGIRIQVDWGSREYREGEMFDEWKWPPILGGWAPRTNLLEGISLSISG